ncbi:MAG: aspartate--tRNA ligase [Candidatus Dormibacteria bacterium]
MCGSVSMADRGQEVRLAGWVNHRRDHGGLTFIDLRDHTGLLQLVFNPAQSPGAHAVAERCRLEWVVTVTGTVRPRPPGSENPTLPTGEVEVVVSACEVLAQAEAMPLGVGEEAEPDERVRLRYRYLDLRRPRMQRNLRARHRFVKRLRDEADRLGFVDLETPTMILSTPEGARDFIVPSRMIPGHVWALPQSPQIYKQLSMVGGFDRYFQIARCWRDEDLRADRQFEFTQLDLEMSFVEDEEEVCQVLEDMISPAWEEAFGQRPDGPWPRLPYREALDRFGSDKPDIRYGHELKDVSPLFSRTSFQVFRKALDGGGRVRALRIPGGAGIPRSQLEGEWLQVARTYGAGGLAYLIRREGQFQGAIAKFFTEDELGALVQALQVEEGDCILFTAAGDEVSAVSLGAVRVHAARALGWVPEGRVDFLWVTEFPLFESNREGGISPMHHPFTQPQPDDWPLVKTDPLRVRSRAYDIVCNGVELGSGSLRITDPEQQQAIFTALGLSREESERKFGFLMSAFRFGAPPHGGFAAGIDRMVMVGVGEPSIREVIAFPKTQTGSDPLTGAPAQATPEQLSAVGLELARSRMRAAPPASGVLGFAPDPGAAGNSG